MSLDTSRLEKPRPRGGKVIARCPACAEVGADKSCEHLFIANEGCGPFGCVAFTGAHGADHRKRIWQLAGDASNPAKTRAMPLVRSKPPTRVSPAIRALRPLTVTEMGQIANLRGWQSFAGLELLTARGLLWYGDVFDAGRTWPSWIITDSEKRNAQARRLDGGVWEGIGGAKAKTLPGLTGEWTIGAKEIGDRPLVVLCEGQPDFCAALFVAWFEGLDVERVAPVCLTGKGKLIHPDALQYFAGKHVRIAEHDDPGGKEAGKKWADQLWKAGSIRVSKFSFHGLTMKDGGRVKDLADFATLLDVEKPLRERVFGDLV